MLTCSCTEEFAVQRSLSTYSYNEEGETVASSWYDFVSGINAKNVPTHLFSKAKWKTRGIHKHFYCQQFWMFLFESFKIQTKTQWYPIVQYHKISSYCISISLNGEGLVKLCELWLSMQIFLSFFSAFNPWSKLKHKTRIIFCSPHNPLNLLLHSYYIEELGHQCSTVSDSRWWAEVWLTKLCWHGALSSELPKERVVRGLVPQSWRKWRWGRQKTETSQNLADQDSVYSKSKVTWCLYLILYGFKQPQDTQVKFRSKENLHNNSVAE